MRSPAAQEGSVAQQISQALLAASTGLEEGLVLKPVTYDDAFGNELMGWVSGIQLQVGSGPLAGQATAVLAHVKKYEDGPPPTDPFAFHTIQVRPSPETLLQFPWLATLNKTPVFPSMPDPGSFGQLLLKRYRTLDGRMAILIEEIQPSDGYRSLNQKQRRYLDGWRRQALETVARAAAAAGYLVFSASHNVIYAAYITDPFSFYETRKNYIEPYDDAVWGTQDLIVEDVDMYRHPTQPTGQQLPWRAFKNNPTSAGLEDGVELGTAVSVTGTPAFETVSVSVNREGRQAAGRAVFFWPGQAITRQLVNPQVRESSWDGPALRALTKEDQPGATLAQLIKKPHQWGRLKLTKGSQLALAMNGTQQNFWERSSFVIADGQMIAHPGASWPEDPWVFVLDAEHLGLRRLSRDAEGVPQIQGIRNAVPGPVLIRGGIDLSAELQQYPPDSPDTNRVRWDPVATVAAFSAIGRTADNRIVAFALAGRPEDGIPQMTVRDMARAGLALGAVELILLGGSMDVQQWVRGDEAPGVIGRHNNPPHQGERPLNTALLFYQPPGPPAVQKPAAVQEVKEWIAQEIRSRFAKSTLGLFRELPHPDESASVFALGSFADEVIVRIHVEENTLSVSVGRNADHFPSYSTAFESGVVNDILKKAQKQFGGNWDPRVTAAEKMDKYHFLKTHRWIPSQPTAGDQASWEMEGVSVKKATETAESAVQSGSTVEVRTPKETKRFSRIFRNVDKLADAIREAAKFSHIPNTVNMEKESSGILAISPDVSGLEEPISLEKLLENNAVERREFTFFDGLRGTLVRIPPQGVQISWFDLGGKRTRTGFRIIRVGPENSGRFLRVFQKAITSLREVSVAAHYPEKPDEIGRLGNLVPPEQIKTIEQDGIVVRVAENDREGIVIRPADGKSQPGIFLADSLTLARRPSAGLEEPLGSQENPLVVEQVVDAPLLGDLDAWLVQRSPLLRQTQHYGQAKFIFRLVNQNPLPVVAAMAAEDWVLGQPELANTLVNNVLLENHRFDGRALVYAYLGQYRSADGQDHILIERNQILAPALRLSHPDELEIRAELLEAIGDWGKERNVSVHLMAPDTIRKDRPGLKEKTIDLNYYMPVDSRVPRRWEDVWLSVQGSSIMVEEGPTRWYRYIGEPEGTQPVPDAGLETLALTEALRAAIARDGFAPVENGFITTPSAFQLPQRLFIQQGLAKPVGLPETVRVVEASQTTVPGMLTFLKEWEIVPDDSFLFNSEQFTVGDAVSVLPAIYPMPGAALLDPGIVPSASQVAAILAIARQTGTIFVAGIRQFTVPDGEVYIYIRTQA
ncbi:MAG: phosphodiester glycosidase family protein [Candidatus Omnitrophica bacterium]|nr:phosphodiester glycosidase family protein [Candidatus Omnitrophota bacterium]